MLVLWHHALSDVKADEKGNQLVTPSLHMLSLVIILNAPQNMIYSHRRASSCLAAVFRTSQQDGTRSAGILISWNKSSYLMITVSLSGLKVICVICEITCFASNLWRSASQVPMAFHLFLDKIMYIHISLKDLKPPPGLMYGTHCRLRYV